MFCPGLPKFKPEKLLHAQQFTEFIAPIICDADLSLSMRFHDISDKGKSGALLSVKGNVTQKINKKWVLVARITSTLMLGGIGGFGFKGKYPPVRVKAIPDTKPDKIIEEQTFPQ